MPLPPTLLACIHNHERLFVPFIRDDWTVWQVCNQGVPCLFPVDGRFHNYIVYPGDAFQFRHACQCASCHGIVLTLSLHERHTVDGETHYETMVKPSRDSDPDPVDPPHWPEEAPLYAEDLLNVPTISN